MKSCPPLFPPHIGSGKCGSLAPAERTNRFRRNGVFAFVAGFPPCWRQFEKSGDNSDRRNDTYAQRAHSQTATGATDTYAKRPRSVL